MKQFVGIAVVGAAALSWAATALSPRFIEWYLSPPAGVGGAPALCVQPVAYALDRMGLTVFWSAIAGGAIAVILQLVWWIAHRHGSATARAPTPTKP